jgi:hypothetical protein
LKKSKLLYLLVAVLILSACQLTTPLQPSSNHASKYQYIFKAPTNPIHLTLELDKAHSAQATIGHAGGQISATGGDGTVYTLDLPQNALPASVVITMTPLAKVTGMPFDGKPTYAVQLQPEGLYLYEDAILTIAPTTAIPLAQQLFFGYQAGGQIVTLAMPVVDSKDLKIRLMHFSGYGVAAEVSAEGWASIDAQLGGDTSHDIYINSLAAEAVAQERADPQSGTRAGDSALGQAVQDLIDQWENDVVKPSLEKAGSSCQAGKDAIHDLLDMERTRQLLGLPSSSATMAKVMELAQSGAIVCINEEYQRCLNQHVINTLLPLYIDQLRQQAIEQEDSQAAVPDSQALVLARDLTTKCLTFELQFHSLGKFDTGDGGYTSEVDGKIMLHFDPATFTIQGSGPMDNLSFTFTMPKGGKGMKCTTTSQTGGSIFEAKSLEYVEDTRSETDPELYVRDFKLLYFPGVTSESYKIHCILTDSQGHQTTNDYSAPPSGYWTGIFFTLHQDELNAGSAGPLAGGPPSMPDLTGMEVGALLPMPAPVMPADGGFFANSWDITSGDVQLASLEWIKDNPAVNLNETGTLKLLHKPGG